MNESPKPHSDRSLILTTISTGVVSVIAIAGLVFTLFFWLRTESNADRREFSNKIEILTRQNHEDVERYVQEFRGDMERYAQEQRNNSNEFRKEMQYFHGKQCTFENELGHLKNELAKK